LGKYSHLKDKLDPFQPDATYQAKVDTEKAIYVGLNAAELARRFAAVRNAKKSLEDAISDCNVQLEALSQLLVNDLESSAIQKIQLDTGETAYIQSEPYSSVEDKSKFMAWVKKKKLSGMLSMPYQSMNALVKELLVQGKPAPDGIKCFLKTSIRLRGGNQEAES
jgi:hypothetical protein